MKLKLPKLSGKKGAGKKIVIIAVIVALLVAAFFVAKHFISKKSAAGKDTGFVEYTVSKGDIIGQVSSIPCESKQENHLHFEIIRDGVWIDPTSIIGS